MGAIKPVARHFPYRSVRHSNGIKRAAQIAVGSALAQGRLVKSECAMCGTTSNVEAHHEDYEKPLDVVWLCRKHHRQHHANPISGIATTMGRKARIWHKTHVSKLMNADVSAPIVSSVTAKIQSLLDAEGVTQNQLASAIGCSRQSLNQSMSGGVRTLRTMAVLADAIGYDVEVVFRRKAR